MAGVSDVRYVKLVSLVFVLALVHVDDNVQRNFNVSTRHKTRASAARMTEQHYILWPVSGQAPAEVIH